MACGFNSHDILVLNFAIKILFKCIFLCNANSSLQLNFHLMRLGCVCMNGRQFSWIFNF